MSTPRPTDATEFDNARAERILTRATQLHARGRARLSLDELQAVAVTAGISPDAVAAAATEVSRKSRVDLKNRGVLSELALPLIFMIPAFVLLALTERGSGIWLWGGRTVAAGWVLLLLGMGLNGAVEVARARRERLGR